MVQVLGGCAVVAVGVETYSGAGGCGGGQWCVWEGSYSGAGGWGCEDGSAIGEDVQYSDVFTMLQVISVLPTIFHALPSFLPSFRRTGTPRGLSSSDTTTVFGTGVVKVK